MSMPLPFLQAVAAKTSDGEDGDEFAHAPTLARSGPRNCSRPSPVRSSSAGLRPVIADMRAAAGSNRLPGPLPVDHSHVGGPQVQARRFASSRRSAGCCPCKSRATGITCSAGYACLSCRAARRMSSAVHDDLAQPRHPCGPGGLFVIDAVARDLLGQLGGSAILCCGRCRFLLANAVEVEPRRRSSRRRSHAHARVAGADHVTDHVAHTPPAAQRWLVELLRSSSRADEVGEVGALGVDLAPHCLSALCPFVRWLWPVRRAATRSPSRSKPRASKITWSTPASSYALHLVGAAALAGTGRC